ncbi:MAG: alpha/beta fold hydrolase [Patescibacteria group bacterium]|jgi:dipeptidyl aminopeptidase/acylaminoacyl peptidase|nr:alpha/beta fold hydrolase [Patescibacteria group bacterium]
MTKKVYFKNNLGRRIVGLLSLPNGGSTPFPAVIICHGFKGYKEQAHLKTLASALASSGIAVLRFDFGNGVGQSYGKLEDIKFSQYLGDLKSAIDYVAKQKYIDQNKLGLAGHSLGGQLILTYAPRDKRIKALADLAGVSYRGWGNTNLEKGVVKQLPEAKKTGYFYVFSKRTGKKYRIKIGYYYDIMKYDTPAQIKKIKVPTLIIHGSKDQSVPLSHSRLAFRTLKSPKKLVIVPDAPHTWRGTADPGGKFQKQINPIVVDWFKKYLPR